VHLERSRRSRALLDDDAAALRRHYHGLQAACHAGRR
jgi:hypothetical protein